MKIAESETKMEGKITSSITQSELTSEGKFDTKIGVIEGEIGTLGATIAGIQTEISELTAGLEIGGLGELGIIIDLIALNSDVSDLESDVEDLWNAIDNIDDKLDAFEEDINEIITWKNELNIPPDFTEDINNINSRLDNFEEDISDLLINFKGGYK
jgi:chromosome segregation ATPase